MSKEIDEKVVSMQFDNKHFEKNVQTSMSTLEKFKQSLKFKGVEKGFEDIDKAAKKVDMTHLGKGLETVQAKFSAMEVVAVTALANITNSAINTGKQLVKSLTLDQITAGMSKYEQKTASVQTLLNSTGKSIEEVNQYLNKLMRFSDETSYGFTDMTAALAQMTSSGGDVAKLVPLITGVANATAFAGKGASEFSRVMYNLNQSYGAGYLQYMDWRSLELAGVGSQQLKQIMIDTGVAMGKIKQGEVTVSNFATTLKDKWADTSVMEAAFGKFAEFSELVDEAVTSGKYDTYSEAIEALGENYDGIGKTAFKAAQEAKTFTEAIDATKDAVSSGWMKTFELIFGNYEQAKVLWTDLANVLWDLFASGGERRNEILGGALNFSPLAKFTEKLNEVSSTVDGVTEALSNCGEIVDKVIRGDFGNGADRLKSLTEAGYNYYEVQNKVNEKLGDSFRYTEGLGDAQKQTAKTQKELTKEDKKRIASLARLTDAELRGLGYTNEQLEAFRELRKEAEKTGLSIDEFIENIDDLNGRWLLINSFKNIGGSLLSIFNSLKGAWAEVFPPMESDQLYNIIAGFHKLTTYLVPSEETVDKLTRTFKGLFAILDVITTVVGGPIKIAFKVITKILGAFDLGILDVTASIGDALVGFRDWLDSVLDFTEVFEKIVPVLNKCIDGVKAWASGIKNGFVDVGKNIIAGLQNGLKGGVASVWNAIVELGKGIIQKFCDILGIHSPSIEFFEIGKNIILGLVNGIKDGVPVVFDFIKNVGSSIIDTFKNANWNLIANAIRMITGFIPSLSKLNNVAQIFTFAHVAGADTMSGLLVGLKDGIGPVIECVMNIGRNIIDAICGVLGIASPSKVMIMIGKYLIAGLIVGVVGSKTNLFDAMGNIGKSLIEIVKNIFERIVEYTEKLDIGSVISVGFLTGVLVLAKKAIDVMKMFGGAAKGIEKATSGFGNLMDALAERINPKKGKFKSIIDNVKNIAIAVVILAGALWVLSKIDANRLWPTLGAVAYLSTVLIILSASISKIEAGDDFGKLNRFLVGLSASLYIMASAIKKLQFLNGSNFLPIIGGFAAMIGGFIGITLTLGKLVKSGAGKDVDKAGILMLKMSVIMLGMATVIKIIGKLEIGEIIKGTACIVAFGVMTKIFIETAQKSSGGLKAAGGMILKIAAAIALMALTMRFVAGMKISDAIKGTLIMAAFGGMIVGLIAATKLMVQNKSIIQVNAFTKLGAVLLGAASAIAIMAVTVKLLSSMSVTEILYGATAVLAFSGIIVGLIAATKLVGGDTTGLGKTLIGVAAAIGIMAASALVLSMLSIEGLTKGVLAVGFLSLIVMGLMNAAKSVENAKGALTAMAVAVGVMAASLVVLSIIDPNRLGPATVALGILMGMFALMAKAASTINKGTAVLITLTVAVGVLAAVLWGMSALDVQNALPNAQALGVLLAVMVGAAAILSKVKMDLASIGAASVALLAMIIPLGMAVGALVLMSDVKNAIANATALTILMASLTVIAFALTGLGAIIVGTAGVGYLAVLAGVGSLVTLITALYPVVEILKQFGQNENAAENAMALTNLIYALTICMAALAVVGPLALVGIAALAVMIVFIDTFKEFAIKLGEELRDSETKALWEEGKSFFQGVADSITSIAKSMAIDPETLKNAKGVIECIKELQKIYEYVNDLEFSDDIEEKITNISIQFKNLASWLTEFAEETDGITGETIKPVVEALDTLIRIADDVNKLSRWDWGNNNTGQFGKNIGELGAGLKDFYDYVDDVSPSVITAAAKAVKQLAKTAKEIPWDFGNNNITLFANDLVGLGKGLNSFSWWLNNGDVFNGKQAIEAAKAAKQLAKTAKEIPWDFGSNNITLFARQLGDGKDSLGCGLNRFYKYVKDVTPSVITGAAKAAKELAIACNEIPAFKTTERFRDLSLSLAHDQGLGNGLSVFNDKVKDIEPSKIKAAAKAAKDLAQMAKDIPSDWGNDNLILFGQQIGADYGLGYGLKGFYTAVRTIEPETINAATKAAKKLADTAVTLSGKEIKTENIKNMSTELKTFGEAVGSFGNGVKDINSETITAAATSSESLVGAMVKISEATTDADGKSKKIDIEAISNLNEVFSAFGEAVKSFSETAKGVDQATVESAASAGETLITTLQKVVGQDGILSNIFTTLSGTSTDTNPDDGAEKLTAFGENLKNFGDAIAAFCDAIGNKDVSKAVTAAEAGGKIVDTMVKMLPSDEEVTGIESVSITEDFKNKLKTFGEAISGFASAFGDNFDAQKAIDAADAGTKIIEATIPLADGIASLLSEKSGIMNQDGTAVNKFVVALQNFGSGINEFAAKAKGVDNKALTDAVTAANTIKDMDVPVAEDVTAATEAINSLKEIISSFSGLDTATVSKFSENLKAIGDTGIKGFIDSFKLPNESATGAISDFVGGMASHLESFKNKNSDIYLKAYALGSYVVTGLVDGITANEFKATNKGKELFNKVCEAFAAAGKIESPSKVFMEQGMYTVLGLVKGISKNSKGAVDATVKMAGDLLKGFQDELGIHSPSLVMNEQGHWIVKGIAEGIKADMSAEEAAKKKAQNIADAFQKEFDRITRERKGRSLDYDLWVAQNPKATDAQKYDMQIADTLDQIETSQKNADLAWDKLLQMEATFGKGSKEAIEASNEFKEHTVNTVNKKNEYYDLKKEKNQTLKDNVLDAINDEIEIRDSEDELYKLQNRNTPEDVLADREQKRLNDNWFDAKKKTKIAEDALAACEEGTDEWREAYKTWLDAQKEEAEYEKAFYDGVEASYNKAFNAEVIANDNKDLDDEIYLLQNEDKLTDREKAAISINSKQRTHNENLKLKDKLTKDANEIYDKLIREGFDPNKSEEYQQKLNDVKRIDAENAQLIEDIEDINEGVIQSERDDAENLNNLASENADILYQIWEKTAGRKATSAEKDAKKIEMLGVQIQSAASNLQISYNEWADAAKKYGENSIEAQNAYNEYLNGQLKLATLQSNIQDIQDQNATRQKSALFEYQDYIEKYEKYYSMNGMSRAQLEKDAKLVSGYDPNNKLNQTLNSTNKALNNVQSNPLYDSVVSSFSAVGTSFTTAISDGVTAGTEGVTTTITTMLGGCTTVLESERAVWATAGSNLVDGLIEGIKSKQQQAIDAAREIAVMTSNALNSGSGFDFSATPARNMTSTISTASVAAQAASVGASLAERLAEKSSGGSKLNNGDWTSSTFTFTQNNYSPKALSSIDIYRQTKNQFAAMKEATT